jgi:lysophospholipase L1-like esterase
LNRAREKSRRREPLLAVLSLVFIILAAEAGLRTFDAIRGYGFISEVRNPLKRDIKPLRPFVTFGFDLYKTVDGVKYISSCHGELYPLNESDDTYRIVVFGGSTTVNKPAFDEAGIHYPLVIQSRLQKAIPQKTIEVINVGYSAYCTAHSLIRLELDVISWNPDLVILSHNLNDLMSAYWPDLTYDYSNKYSDEAFSVPNLKEIYTRSNVIFEHSQLYWYLRNRIRITRGIVGSEMSRISYGNTPPPLVIEIFKRNLGTFITVARASGAEVLLGSQPLQPSEEYFLLHMGAKSYNVRMKYPLHEEFVQHHRILNDAIKEVAEEHNVLYLDNDAGFAGEKQYFIDFVHYSPAGVRKLGNDFADYLLSVNLQRLMREP